MNADIIRNLKWGNISDWSSVPMTDYDTKGNSYISKADIYVFITNYVKEMARKFNIEFSDLYKIIKDENQAFYSIMDNIFDSWTGLNEDSKELKTLKNYFKVPLFSQEEKTDPVNDLLVQFELLTDIQKIDVLSKLQLISVKVVNTEINARYSITL